MHELFESYCYRYIASDKKCIDRITTNKTRIISRNQQMMRLDAEITMILIQKDEEVC
jgi:bifunctional ADP-heptose synthase (sugar kinase/adenylyltransferase)